MFSEYVSILEALVTYGRYGGLTVGGVYQRTLLPRNRIVLCLKKLHEEGYVTREIVPHRPGVNKHLWKSTEKTFETLQLIVLIAAPAWEE